MIKIPSEYVYSTTPMLRILPWIFHYVEKAQQIWKVHEKNKLILDRIIFSHNLLKLEVCSSHTHFVHGEGWRGPMKHYGVNMHWTSVTLFWCHLFVYTMRILHFFYDTNREWVFKDIFVSNVMRYVYCPKISYLGKIIPVCFNMVLRW